MPRNLQFLLAPLVFLVLLSACASQDKNTCMDNPTSACLLRVARDIALQGPLPAFRAELIVEIAIVQFGIGESDEMRKSMALAEASVLQVQEPDFHHGDRDRNFAWSSIAAAWVTFGDFERATRLVASAPDESARMEAIRAMVKAQIAGGDVAGAQDVATKVKAPRWRAEFLLQVAEAQYKAGAVAVVRDTMILIAEAVGRIGHKEMRIFSLAQHGHLQARIGRIGDALKTASGLVGFANHDWLIRQIAFIQARKGKYDAVRRTLGLSESVISRATGYSMVALIAAQSGSRRQAGVFFESALAVSKSIANAEDRDTAFHGLASSWAGAGDYRMALRTATQISAGKNRDRAYRSILHEMIEADDLSAALLVPPRLGSLGGRADAHGDIGLAQSKSGGVAPARQSFLMAIETAKKISDKSSRNDVLSAIANQQAEARDFEGALRTATLIGEGFKSDGALSKIAIEKAHAKDVHGALEIARRIKSRWSSVFAYTRIAKAMSKSP